MKLWRLTNKDNSTRWAVIIAHSEQRAFEVFQTRFGKPISKDDWYVEEIINREGIICEGYPN